MKSSLIIRVIGRYVLEELTVQPYRS